MAGSVTVSVITPCYNAEAYLGWTVESVLRQDYADWEYIIVDDGSTDGSAAVARRYAARDGRLRLIQTANGGVSVARNRGFAASSPESRYLLFLDADDVLHPTAITRLVAHLEQHPAAGLVFCNRRLVDSRGAVLDVPLDDPHLPQRLVPAGLGVRTLPDSRPETPLAALVARFGAIPSSSLFRRAVFARTAGWNSAYRIYQDRDIVIQMALRAPVHYLPDVLLDYRRHDRNVSNNSGYAELVHLNRAWWSAPGLTPAQRRQVRRAIVFDDLLAMRQQFGDARMALRRHELVRSLRQSLRGLKRSAIVLSRSAALARAS